MDRKGFTLIELLIVVAIIGILAAISIPGYVGYQKRAARAEAYTNLEALRLLQEQYYAEYGEYADRNAGADGTLAGLAAIQVHLPTFKPGAEANLGFQYSIDYTVAAGITNSFTAKADGKANTRVEGDSFWIDQDNLKNF